MSDPIAVGIISSASVLAGVAITQIFEYLKRRSDEKRWYADYFLPKKFDAILDFYAQLQTAHGALLVQRHRKIADKDELEEKVISPVNQLTHKYHLAGAYLSEGVTKEADEYLALARQAGAHIASRFNPIKIIDKGQEKTAVIDWPEGLDTQYIAVRKKIVEVLNPEFLKKVEKRWQ
ncbi:MAG TPA: hypothetical protein VHA05_02615 [Candidatus Saccharimonadales bacterium]|nr:hypothetical protein [Candidatus Saccharimonadales bacterium]